MHVEVSGYRVGDLPLNVVVLFICNLGGNNYLRIGNVFSVHTVQQYKLFSGYIHKHQQAQEVQPGTALPLAKTEKVPWP